MNTQEKTGKVSITIKRTDCAVDYEVSVSTLQKIATLIAYEESSAKLPLRMPLPIAMPF